MILNSFQKMVAALPAGVPTIDHARICDEWLASVTLTDVITTVSILASNDLPSLSRHLPAMLQLCHFRGYILELLYWNPTIKNSIINVYEIGDIHSHFDYTATKALIGNPYIGTDFQMETETQVSKVGETLFSAGMHYIVCPETIHSVRYATTAPSLTLRVVLPPSVGEMYIYDARTGSLRNTIKHSIEDGITELAGMMTLLDTDAFSTHIKQLRRDLLSADSYREFARLTAL